MRRVVKRKSGIWNKPQKTDFYKALYNSNNNSNNNSNYTNAVVQTTNNNSSHSLTNTKQNELLRAYEVKTKQSFDEVKDLIDREFTGKNFSNICSVGNKLIDNISAVELDKNFADVKGVFARKFYIKTIFAKFLQFSNEFFTKDPLNGQQKQDAERMFQDCGFHAVGIAPCADGRLAHISSYVLRLPFGSVRRKARAGSLFDIGESVRDWVFIEHDRFRKGIPNLKIENTKYLKIAVYHYSKSDPTHQGCAAHGSDDSKAASAALDNLKNLKKAIEGRFGNGATVQMLLMGINTDDDSLRVHIPNSQGNVCLQRFVETSDLYNQTLDLTESEARLKIEQEVERVNLVKNSTKSTENVKKVVSWLIANNFSQIEYVKNYENGMYADIGHAERFISVGSGFEEVQLRNLSYYSFLDTIEESVTDIDVGIQIFKGLNIKNNLPIPIIIRCDYNSSVPGSRDRAKTKALRINNALVSRYKGFAKHGWLETLVTLKDWSNFNPIEVIDNEKVNLKG